jgi:hypothetical protein
LAGSILLADGLVATVQCVVNVDIIRTNVVEVVYVLKMIISNTTVLTVDLKLDGVMVDALVENYKNC